MRKNKQGESLLPGVTDMLNVLFFIHSALACQGTVHKFLKVSSKDKNIMKEREREREIVCWSVAWHLSSMLVCLMDRERS